MNVPPILPTAAAALSLILSIWLFVASGTNSSLQGELQKKQTELQNEQQEVQLQNQQLQAQQEQIATGIKLAQEVGPAVVRDLGTLAVQNKNEAIKKMLSKYGVTVQEGADGGKAVEPAKSADRPVDPPKAAGKP
jgi:hypothetical protein